MTLTFRKYTGFGNVLYKTFETATKSVTGTLRNRCSLTDPVIDIDMSSDKDGFLNIYNYCTIDEFKRSYFIMSKEVMTDRLLRLTLHVDAISSFASSVEKSNVFINRTSDPNLYDTLAQDNMRSFENELNVEVQHPTNMEGVDIDNFYSWNTDDTSDYTINGGCFVITFLGSPNIGGNNYPNYLKPPSDIGLGIGFPEDNKVFMTSHLALSEYNINQVCCNIQGCLKVIKFLTEKESARASVLSICAYPFKPPVDLDHTTTTLTFGKEVMEETTGVVYYACYTKYMRIGQFSFPSPTGFSFNDPRSWMLSEFKYELFLPFKGWLEIPSEKYINNSIVIYYLPDFVRKKAYIYLYSLTSTEIIYTDECEIGCEIPLTQSNLQEINDKYLQTIVSTTMKTLTGAVAIGLGVATASPLKIAGGVAMIGSGIADAVVTGKNTHVSMSTSVSSANSGFFDCMKPYVRITSKKPIFDDNSVYYDQYVYHNGLPCMKRATISAVATQSFVICGSVDVPFAEGMTTSERTEIATQLQNGLFIGARPSSQ